MSSGDHVVSLGMPALNSEKYIAESIESLLAQSYTDFELVISNNASTDRTREICENYARKDKRIRVHHMDTTVNMFQNFETVFRLSQGRYFAWVGSHDLWHPEWLENLVAELDKNSSVVLAYPLTVAISAEGQTVSEPITHFETHEANKLERLYRACAESYRAGPMAHGLFRSEVLNKILPASRVTLGDKQLVIETSIFGGIKQVEKDLWYRRHTLQRSTYDDFLESQVDERLFGSSIPFHARFPHIAHSVGLFIKYCVAPKEQDFSHFWDGLLAAIMYWEGKRSFIQRELDLLDKTLSDETSEKAIPPLEGRYIGDASFLEEGIRLLCGRNIDRIIPSTDLHNVLTLGLMIYHHYNATRHEYEVERMKLVMEKEKSNAQYWHYEASLFSILRDRAKKIAKRFLLHKI